jgi:hypothetical protein
MISRRQFGTGAAAMAGDKLRRPLNAPPAVTPAPGVQPGSTGVEFARIVIVFGPAGGQPVGVFVYAQGTTPGPGNPPVLSMTLASKDPYGNAIDPGLTAADPLGHAVSLIGGLIQFSNGAQILETGTGALSLAPVAGEPVFIPDGPLTADGGTAADPTVIETDTWHNVGAAAGFTVDTVQRYTLKPDNTVHIQFSLASANTGGTYTLFTLPAGYIPAVQYDGAAPGIFNTTGTFTAALLNTRFRVTTGGAVQIVSLPGTAINNVSGYYVVPLD